MATVKQLLKEASNANFDDFSSKVEALLEVVLEHNFGHEEARLYSDFIQKCLHTFVTKLKGLQNEDQIEEVLKTGIICGGAYRHLLSSLERDEKHVVPSLLYHVVHSIQDRIQTFADYVISISDLAYQILDAIGFPKSAHTIACAFHGYLWNSSSKLLKQGSCQTVKQVLILRKISLLFICCLPEKSKIVSMLQYVITHYTQYNKDWEDEGTSKTLCGIFQDVSDKLRDKNDTDEEKTACDRLVVQIQALLVEYLLKTSDYVKAKEIITVMSVLCDNCSTCRSVVDCYLYSVTNQEALQSSQKSDICIAKLKDTNSNMSKDIQSGQREELKVLFRALVNFVQSLSSKQLGSLDAGLVDELTQSCKILLTLCTKLQSECKNMLKKETDKGKLKELSDENVEYVTVSLQGYYRQLQFMQKMIEANSDEGLCGECVNMAEKFQQCLEDSVSVLSKKTENNHRCNLGYVSSVTGSACMQAGNYEMAATLYKIAVNQLYRFQQPTLIKVFEKLVDCYIHMEKWKEAVEVVYQALFTVENGLKQVLAIWIKLKKEASNKEVFFQSLTLNGVLKSSSKEVKGISGRQLLLAEYQAWKQISRRQYIIEYHILDELLNTTETPVQKAEVLVALAATMCITGYNTHDMPAGDMLDRAIVLFDENFVGSESSLAVACYTKYILLHEEAVEYMKNDTGEVEYFGKRDISENSRFTLQQEQDNLPLLVRAIELWEKSLGPNKNVGQSSSNGAKSRKAVGRKSEVVEATETLFGVEHHVDTLIMCGTRLITMKQPQLALRALEVAKEQLSYVKDLKRASDLSIQLSRGLMLLSRYDEAETVVDCKGDNRKNPTPLYQSLLLSELYILTGKRETGLKILQSILDSNDLLGKTQKVYFIQGTAKRLLSVALCLPGSGHMIKSANQYLLSLAFEAVQCHFTVINYLTKNKTLDQNADKWLILNEMLSSILHLCQLCRFIGLPREALCYLKAGLNISQGQGLPRWSCEFLIEMLGVQSLEADNERALLTAESLDCILSTENQSKNNTQNQARKGSKSNNQSSDKQSALFISNENDNFGFQDPADSMKMDSDTTEKTPERVYVKKELDSEKKNKMRKMKTPDCTCMVEKYDLCPDVVRHRLCMKAGIVFSEFLAQTDMRNIADKLLSEVQTKFDLMMSFDSNTADMSTKHVSTVMNGHMLDSQVLYSHLEACCIKAESYLHQKNFHKVHQIWKSFQNLEQSGNLSNVVHSSILLTRLALCDAAGYMLSLHGDRSESVTKINLSDTDESITDIAKKLERQSLKPRRKVSFESEIEKPTLTGTSVKKLKKKLARDTIDMKTLLKPAIALVNTPKFSARKTRNPLTTPSANRMDVLQKLMASDEEDDLIVFPDLKPVTPKVNLKSSKSSRVKPRCFTEPRNPSSMKPASVKAENPIACKLDFLLQNNDEENSDELEKEKKSGKQSKKRQNSVVSSVNDGKDCPGENSVVKNSTRKSKIVKKKSALDQTNQTGKNIVSNSDLSVRFDENEKVLTEKGTSDNELKVENKNGYHSQFKGDVFDFEMEASPDVGKATKTGKGRGKSKLSQKKKMANVSSKVSNNAENDDIQADDKENEKAPEVRRSTRRCQAKTETDNTELVRRNSDSSDYSDLEISLDELTFDNDTDNVDLSQENSDVELSEPVNTKDWLETNHISTLESSEEPTEIMRGKTSSKTKTKKSERCVEKAAVGNNTDLGTEGNSCGEDGHNTSRSVEQMRSARLASMNDLVNILDPDDQPSVSCIEMPLSGETSPCGADIIPTLQSLYERLCHFPPNPQHSDICHILALHYLETDPRKAAFLLSDASAVTFRHQVMLNIAKKARKVAKEGISAAGGNVSTSNTIMFGRDDLRLPDILTSIPEDWCVVQLSVVSVGLPWKQMILTRFAKDKDPVIVKLPGFSSPQGCHILKDFSQIMESNAETAGITSTTEWWSARRKLDADMESLVERIEKHWLGHWRHTLLPGEYPKRVLDLACKEIGKVAQKDVKTADIELLLLAGKVLSEKELKQCVSDVVGPDVLSCHGDSIVSVLKKYSSLGVDNEKQHTILILDKSVQHLPWESIPILSDRSVSRMPCLSHLIMQLADHQTRNHSVFIKGVNPKNTFYILNPDSDLQRTQDFFKNWFESEKDWSGVIGCRPTSEQFIDALTKKDFFIYCGHGSGGRIFTSDDIEKLTARAVTMLMGCSSGRLVVKGQFEPSGMMISYFLAGCPSMVANLWDVTDKDIDKFTEEVIKTWISSADGTYLPKLVQKSRAICKLKYLNGLAPVVYGLPVFINKGKK